MNQASDNSSAFAPLWRWKWLILMVGVLAALGAYLHYKNKPLRYSASTLLYLASSEERALVVAGQSKAGISPRVIGDQTALINSSLVGEAARKILLHERLYGAIRDSAQASSGKESNLISLSAEASGATDAAGVVNAYAQAYIDLISSRHGREVKAAIARTHQEIQQIETAANQAAAASSSAGKSPAPGHTAASAAELALLTSRLSQLDSELTSPLVTQIGPATASSATLISTSPRSDAIFGLLIGLALASLGAYALDRVDRRLRSLAQLEAIFDAPVLAALPSTRLPVRIRDGMAVPADALVEPLRRLHMSIRTGSFTGSSAYGVGSSANGAEPAPPRSLLFVSADPGDGKSTLVAGLALVARDAEERVALVEADLRRPVQSALLNVTAQCSIAQVLAGELSAEDATKSIGPASTAASASGAVADSTVATVVEAPAAGALSALLCTEKVANPPALLGSPRMAALLSSLSHENHLVLVDGPLPMAVSDVMPLLRLVDGIVIVVRLRHTREASARRLTELLLGFRSAPIVGIVANAAPRAELRRAGFSSAVEPAGRMSWLRGR